jgi:ABC-2 type transport system permease protein
VVAAAARIARADLRAIYTPVTWTLGWLGRIVVQVLFFAAIGLLLHDPGAVRYLFVGQAVMACAIEAFMAIASTTWERAEGTLALLIAAPAPVWPVFVGRSLQWLPSGIATSGVALFAVGPAIGITWTPTRAAAALGCLVLIAAGSYAVALTLAAAVLRGPRWRNVVSNVGSTLLMLITGATVPTVTWPAPVRILADGLPLTHGLAAIRALQGTGSLPAAGQVAAQAGWAALTGAGWLLAAIAALTMFAETGRRAGTIDFAE